MLSDYYKILGVEPNATQEAIIRAYKRLLRIYHPDKPKNSKNPDALRMAQDISEAFAILADITRRREYDSRRADEGCRPKVNHGVSCRDILQ
jgi:curved DNA-binding protein CbpA